MLHVMDEEWGGGSAGTMKTTENKQCLLFTTPLVHRTLSRGVLSMATFLESKGFTVQVAPLAYHLGFNKNWSREELAAVLQNIVSRANPVLVGVSNQFTGDYPVCLEILKICKQANSGIVTAIGGVHATFADRECFDSPYVDVVVRGEGEWTLPDLILALENKRDLNEVQGITFRKNGVVTRTPDRPPGDLADLPPLDFSLLPEEFIQNIFVHGMQSRGCDFKCTFCGESSFWGRRRNLPVSRLVEEMETLDRVYDNPMSAIDDSMEYIGSPQFAELCNEIRKRNIRLHRNCYIMSRAGSFTGSDLKNLEGTGIRYVQLGIESASPKVLRMMNKRIDREQIIASCVMLKEYGLKAHGLWMIGHPGDNPSEAQLSLDTLEYLLKNDLLDKVDISVFVPNPGTVFFSDPQRYGIEILSRDWSHWIQPLFGVTSSGGGAYKPVCQLRDFTAGEIMDCYKKAHMIVLREKPEALRYTHEEFNKRKRPI